MGGAGAPPSCQYDLDDLLINSQDDSSIPSDRSKLSSSICPVSIALTQILGQINTGGRAKSEPHITTPSAISQPSSPRRDSNYNFPDESNDDFEAAGGLQAMRMAEEEDATRFMDHEPSIEGTKPGLLTMEDLVRRWTTLYDESFMSQISI